MKFRAGNVVMLRCGSQKMVVARPAERPPPDPQGISSVFPPEPFRPGIICRWMVQGAARMEVFEEETLILVDE